MTLFLISNAFSTRSNFSTNIRYYSRTTLGDLIHELSNLFPSPSLFFSLFFKYQNEKATLSCCICNARNYAYEGGSHRACFYPEARYEPEQACVNKTNQASSKARYTAISHELHFPSLTISDFTFFFPLFALSR